MDRSIARQRIARLDRAVERFGETLAAIGALLAAGAARPPGALEEATAALPSCRGELRAALRGFETLEPDPARRPGHALGVELDRAARLAGAVGAALRRWEGVTALLADACAGRAVRLYPPQDPADTVVQALSAMDRAFLVLDRAFADVEQDPEAAAHGCFADIRLRPSHFLAHMQAAWRLLSAEGRVRGARFLDVGCGAGSKVLIASGFFAEADGLEYDPGYVAVAGRLIGTPRAPRTRVFAGDALAFEGYGAYDVIYFYAPMRDTEKLRALEERIAALARPGAVLVSPYDEFPQRARELGAEPVGGAVSLAGTGPEAAAARLAAAERVGTRIPDPGLLRDLPQDGLWAPLLHGLRAAGFGG